VRAGLLDDDGQLLLGTYSHGLVRIEPGQPAHRLGEAEGFPWTRVMSLYRDRNGHLWIGTQHGLARHDGQRTIEFETLGPAFARAVFFITEDGDGSLWFTGNNGIVQIPFEALSTIDRLHDEGMLHQLRHRRVDAVDGLRSRQINGTSQPAGLRAANGWLWFPTTRGIAALDPTRMMAPEPPPKVFIEDIVVQGETVSVPSAGLPMLRFASGTERIEFLLSGVQGLMPDSPLVQTRLVGFDEDWGPPSLRRDVLYAALPPGRFRFEARAFSPRGTPGLEPAVLEFEIRPTLSQRAWFWPVLVLSAGLLASVAMLWRARRLRQRTQGLERSIAMRTLELREKNQALETALEQVEHISQTDALTGVYNRRFLESIIGEQARLAERNHLRQAGLPTRQRRGLVLLVVDIDFFKEVNDRHGHAIGDEVLKAFASMLRESVRGDDLVVRWGGEEFVVLMRESSLEDGIALARRIIGNARQTAVQIDGLRIQRTCSIGLACHPFLPAAPGNGDWSETIDVADQAMYQAKARGRDGWVALLAPDDATDPGLARRLVRDVTSTLGRGDALMEAEKRRADSE
jgi:diguanylate cyclase (GGDEF)-like protein